MALLPGQAGRVLLGVLALIGIRLLHKYVRLVETVVAILVLVQVTACVITRLAFPKFERGPEIFQEARSTSTSENTRTGSKGPLSRRQEEIQMHLRRLEMAAFARASTSNERDHFERDFEQDVRPNFAPRSQDQVPDQVIHRHRSFEGYTYTEPELTRPNRPSRSQGEEIQRHLQRLASAAAAGEAGVHNASPSLL